MGPSFALIWRGLSISMAVRMEGKESIMSASTSLVAMSMAHSEFQLIEAREQAQIAAGEPRILVLVAIGPDPARTQAAFEDCFVRTAVRIVRDRAGVVFYEDNLAVCGQFPGDATATVIETIKELQLALRACPEASHPPVMMSIAKSEFAACQLLHIAGDDQAVVDEEIWETFSPDVKKDLREMNAHNPDYETADRRTEELADEVMQEIFGTELRRDLPSKFPKPLVKPERNRTKKPASRARVG